MHPSTLRGDFMWWDHNIDPDWEEAHGESMLDNKPKEVCNDKPRASVSGSHTWHRFYQTRWKRSQGKSFLGWVGWYGNFFFFNIKLYYTCCTRLWPNKNHKKTDCLVRKNRWKLFWLKKMLCVRSRFCKVPTSDSTIQTNALLIGRCAKH